MEYFEVHITGDESILSAAKGKLKTISVDLLKPDGSCLRTEHMTSQIMEFACFNTCKDIVLSLVESLKKRGVNVIRTKIESPYYQHYVDQGLDLYLESHFKAENEMFPLSRSQHKPDERMATYREYDRSYYPMFRDFHKNYQIELCLLDTYVEEDYDWFSLYQIMKPQIEGYFKRKAEDERVPA